MWENRDRVEFHSRSELYMNSYFAREKIIFKDPLAMAKPVDEEKKDDEVKSGMHRYARTI